MSLRVLHLIDSGGLYGAEHMLLDLACAQRERGLQPEILSAGTPADGEKPLEPAARARGLTVHAFRMRAGLNISKGMEVLRFAQREGFDILHSHGYKFNVLLGLLPRHMRRIPLLGTVHGYVHAPVFSKMWFNRQLYNFSFVRMDMVVCVSEATRNDAGFFGRHAVVINNGLDLQEQAAGGSGMADTGRQADDFLIAAFGRLSGEKGFRDLVTAFTRVAAQLPGARLCIWGEGGMRAELEQLIASGGMNDRVELPGYSDQVEALLGNIQLVVIPSYSEGLPMILLEAMKYRVPVIASRVGAMPDVLGSGSCGILVPPGDANSLGEAIREVWHDRGAALERAERAHTRLETLYSSRVMEEQYRQVYMRLLGETG